MLMMLCPKNIFINSLFFIERVLVYMALIF